MLISNGEEPMWVSKQMGHASLQVTLRRYTDWMPNKDAVGGYQARNDWNAYLGKNSNVVLLADGTTNQARV